MTQDFFRSVPGFSPAPLSRRGPHADIIQYYIDQSSQPIFQHLPISTQQLPSVHPAYPASLQENPLYMACVKCPSIWRSHLESIMLSDPEDKGMSGLKRSYRDLQQHINEAHSWEYGADCAACEELFCYHLDNVMLLEVAKGDLCEVKTDLRSSCKALRDHIKGAHSGC